MTVNVISLNILYTDFQGKDGRDGRPGKTGHSGPRVRQNSFHLFSTYFHSYLLCVQIKRLAVIFSIGEER